MRLKPRRPGLSLLEVILSLAILLMAVAALSFLMTTSTDAALESKHRSQAALYAQSKLAEVRTGIVALQAVPDSGLEDDADYSWSMAVEDGTVTGLKNVRVKVWRQLSANRRVEVSMTQMILDPTVVGSSQDGSGTNSTTEPDPTTSGSK